MGKIKMGGNSTMEFEPDYCEFHITVSAINENSGYSISKGRRITESLLRLLNERIGIDIKDITLENEKTDSTYDNDDNTIYDFEKKLFFCYKADNRITEAITELLEDMSGVTYNIKFKLNNKSEKEQLVMSTAVNDSKEKAEKLAEALGSRITGFEEIKYRFNEYTDDVVLHDMLYMCMDGSTPPPLASDLKNPKIEISKTVEIIWLTD